MTPMKTSRRKNRNLSASEIALLEANGCWASDWSKVLITDETDLSAIIHVDFIGNVVVGALSRKANEGIFHATIENTTIGDHTFIHNVSRRIRNASIGDRVRIENVDAIEFEPGSKCGISTEVSVLDETGSRPVVIFPGISSQIATLQARCPEWAKSRFVPMLDHEPDSTFLHQISDDAVIEDCGIIKNVFVGKRVNILGASRLVNGSIINNVPGNDSMAFIGHGVDAENFIIEDGKVDGGAFVRNCYIGQGAIIDKGFTAHDSLFFANAACENGEACAIIAGPYTVTMHKSTLLIGAQFSFSNAGSATNQSNHMYKLGPIHWGVMERGVKTSSGSYVMWGARIGAYSLIMGKHKNHPDTSDFPFSYLFGDDAGVTTLVPATMLRSCGLLRDSQKWPKRDRRNAPGLPLHDIIDFRVLSPVTIQKMVGTLRLIPRLKEMQASNDPFIQFKGSKIRVNNLDRAATIYSAAIKKYIHSIVGSAQLPEPNGEAEEWIDLGGQIMTRSALNEILSAESLSEIRTILAREEKTSGSLEAQWISNLLGADLRYLAEDTDEGTALFDKLIEEDRIQYLKSVEEETDMLAL